MLANHLQNSIKTFKFNPIRGICLGILIITSLTQNTYAQHSEAWVEESNQHSVVVLEALATHFPEYGSDLGLEQFDEEIRDITPGFRDRYIADLKKAVDYLESQLEMTNEGPVKQDLQILLKSVNSNVTEMELNDQYLLPYYNVSGQLYSGIRSLLEDRIPAERRKAAIVRLSKYTGSHPGYRPVTELAREYITAQWKDSERIAPFKEEVERDLTTSKQYIDEIGELFKKYEFEDYENDYQKLVDQINLYNEFIEKEILPKARTDFKLPKEIYEFQLQEFGVDMPVNELRKRAMVAFKELQTQMQVLANQIAIKNNYPSSDYRDVIRSLKENQLDSASILPFYQQTIKDIEEIISREKLLTLPDRDMVIRLATPAESAAAPAPFMSPPRLIGNTGEYGEFVLPLKATGGAGGTSLKIDDFTHKAAAWPLTAHEGRPGHELQYTSIIEKGVSQARIIFAMNSVNVEGWALYTEEIVQPYLPLEGQFMTLWSRLVRSGRAFLDPGLNMGLITTEEARYILSHEIVLSEALVRSELERYRFRAPGQATSYFNGYLRLMELRAETEMLLGENFNQMAFHDFILSQGLLPPTLIRDAVLGEFVPTQEK
jgi:hypothetical protein